MGVTTSPFLRTEAHVRVSRTRIHPPAHHGLTAMGLSISHGSGDPEGSPIG